MKIYIVFLLFLMLFFLPAESFSQVQKERDVIVLTGNRAVFGEILDRGLSVVVIRLDDGKTRTISRRHIIAITTETGYYMLYGDRPRVEQALKVNIFSGPSFTEGYGLGYGIVAGYQLKEGYVLGLMAHLHEGETKTTILRNQSLLEETSGSTFAFYIGYVQEIGRFTATPYLSFGVTSLKSSGFTGYTQPMNVQRLSIPLGLMLDFNLYKKKLFLGVHAQRGFVPGIFDTDGLTHQSYMFTEGPRHFTSLMFSSGYRF